jgi:hypothetical protein
MKAINPSTHHLPVAARHLPSWWLLVAFLVLLGDGARAEQETFALTIRPGDTLIGISQRYLDRVARWPELKRLNRIGDELRLVPGNTLRIPVDWMRWSPGDAEVLHVHGEVRGTHGPLLAGMRLREGETFSTGSEGTLTLRLRDGSTATFPPGTEARMGVLRKIRGTALDDTIIEMGTGATESRVPSLRSSGSRYEIRTPRVITAVRGTHFRIAAEGEASHHELLEGGLYLAGTDRTTRLDPGQGLRADGGRLGAPVPLAPAPDLSTLPSTVTRIVTRLHLPAISASDTARRWRWQVANDETFLSLLKDERTSSPEWLLAGLPDGDYFLRVRTADDQDIEGLDAVRPFAMRARPEPPAILGPAPGGLVAGPPKLRWTKNTESTRVRLQVARDPGFTDVLLDRQDLTSPEFAFSAALSPGEYHWRLASLRADGHAGPLGDPATFRQIEPSALSAPEVVDGQVRLTWSGPADLDYVLQIAATPDFASPLREEDARGNRHALADLSGGTYFVRTRPRLPGDETAPWSAPQRFEVPVATPWWLPILILPLL